MCGIEEIIKEVIILSDVIKKLEFRSSFTTHFTSKVKELEIYSSRVDVKILQGLQLKLLERILVHLRTTTNSNDKCELIGAIIQVLKLTPICSDQALFDVYTLVFFEIFKGRDLPYQPSEVLKEYVLECCTYLMKNSTEEVVEKIYREESGVKLSLGISVSVNMVKEEKSIKLRVAALDFLLAASKFENQAQYSDELFNKLGDLFMLYLPGILAPLLEVILRDETQHHLITAKALTCWGHVLCLVMKDPIGADSPPDIEIMKQWLELKKKPQESAVDVSKGLKEKKRTQLWLESAALTLCPLIIKLSNVRKHSHPKCRLELTKVMARLLKNCMRNLKACLAVIVEVLVSSAMDIDAEVRQVAEEALSEFEAECSANSGLFASVVEDNLYSLLNRLPCTLKAGNEQLLLSSLKSFSGYLRLLGRLNRLHHLVSLSSTLKKLVSVLKLSFELEMYPEISNQDFSVWDNDMGSQIWHKPWKRFRYFADHEVQIHLEEICHHLGRFAESETIFDFLLDMHYEDCSWRKEILLILNEVISGASDIKDHVVSQLLDFYLEPQNLYLPLHVMSCGSLKETQSNIIRVALLMEGIGKLAKGMGKRFQDHLLKSLYYVLERMGSNYSIIREAAKKCAIEIANACELEDGVTSLIQNNVDYLTYHLSVKLKRNDESVFEVVTVLMRNSPFENMPNVEEIINNILRSSSQSFDSPHTFSYLRLLQTFVVCVNRFMKIDRKHPSENTPPRESATDRLSKELETLTEECDKETEFEDEVGDEQLQESPEDADLPEESEKPELPRYLKLTLAVAKHCLHYLASKDKAKKIIVLEILNECVWALSDWENDLLPLVHQIWSPLVTRFELVTEPLMINRSFQLLCTLSFVSKDFIRARTLKDVLPALEAFLIKQAAKSKLKTSASEYFFTQSFKLQRELLGNLGKLTTSIGLFERQTDLVVESGLPYLSSHQPRELQEKCKLFFEDLKAHDPHLVWFKIHPLVKNPEFAKNSEIVLNSIK